MPNPKGNPNICGNKNSGRKSVYEEHNKSQAINTLWEKVNKKVQANEELTEYEEKLVLSVLPKTIKQQSEVSGEIKTALVKYIDGKDDNNTNTD